MENELVLQNVRETDLRSSRGYSVHVYSPVSGDQDHQASGENDIEQLQDTTPV